MPAASRTAARAALTITLLALILGVLAVVASGLGFIAVSPGEVLDAVLGAHGAAGVQDALHRSVVLEVRLPRILCAMSVGFGLAMAGAVFQGLLLNPLADPFTLGVSSGAAFGAALSLLLGLHFLGPATLGAMAFLGAAATLLTVMALSGRDSDLSPTNLILSGVIVSAILSAGISFIKYLADERVSVHRLLAHGQLRGPHLERRRC